MTNVHDFGARGDGKTDDTAALTHAIQRGDGNLVFPRGDYRIARPLYVPLQLHGRLSIDGAGAGARLVMHGAGPALHLVGTHRGSALPGSVQETVWTRERLPVIHDLEIVGQHAEADGIRVEGVMQPTFQRLLLRNLRHGIHLTSRDRNVIISDCHIYNNSGIGVFLDRLNLHQINIHGNHISYCKQGGLRIEKSEIRNIQICSNDIEYNFDAKAPASADVLVDCREGTVREGTIVGNTIQASLSPGGANVRFLGAKDHPNAVGLFAITGNLLGSQSRVLDLHHCRGVTIAGNSIYSGYHHAIWLENSEHVVVNGNTIDHNPEYRGTSTDQVVLRSCRNVNITGVLLQHTRPGTEPVQASLMMDDCQNVNLTGLQILNARTRGVQLENCRVVRVAGCTIRGPADDKTYRTPVAVAKNCAHIMVVDNFLERGSDGPFALPHDLGVAKGNVFV